MVDLMARAQAQPAAPAPGRRPGLAGGEPGATRCCTRWPRTGRARPPATTARNSAFDDVPHGGYYTLADLAEIAAYARARAVTIVPEIDVPGHASAILAAYPALGVHGRGALRVLDRWGISPAILSPLPADRRLPDHGLRRDRSTPSATTPYFHIGGDECVLDHWASSPEIVAYRESLGLAEPSDLQAWFLRRLADALAERGSRAVVWDEAFVSGRLRQDTIVMPWRGHERRPPRRRGGPRRGRDPGLPAVLRLRRGGLRRGADGDRRDAITVADVAAFDPAPATGPPSERSHVLGVSSSSGASASRTPGRSTTGLAAGLRGRPRSPGGPAGDDFDGRLDAHLGRLDALGVEYRPPAGPAPLAAPRPHRPGVIDVSAVMARIDEMTLDAESTRPSV